ncbi:MAG: hypothetical protein LN415_05210 [Candidatus Thermoplasmatota archaeon]|nr:hypothetical protein [Candidatus Thermoplasmatota archaeon]
MSSGTEPGVPPEETSVGEDAEGEGAETQRNGPEAIPRILIITGLIIIMGSYIGLNHLVVNLWDAEPLQMEIAIDVLLIGALLVAVGFVIGAMDVRINRLVRVGMVIGIAVLVSLLVYEALVLFGSSQIP